MTFGRPSKHILAFALPLIFGNLFQQLYSMADSIIVGQYLGVDALAAVGSVGSLQFLILGFCMGSCAGLAIPIAQRFGAHDEENLRKYVANSVWLSAAMGLIVTAITVALARQILVWMQTPANIIDEAYAYFAAVLLGIPAMILYNLASSIMRALGDSKSPVWFLAAASAINIVLDLLTVCVLGLGVAGAALATVVSQLGSGLLCVGYLKKHFPILRMEKDDWKLRRPEAMRLLGMGVPVGLQFSITAIGSVMLQSAVNSLGAVCVSGVAVASKIYMLLCCPFDALAMAATNFTGQNLGAGKYDRIRQGTYACLLLGIIYCALYIVIARFGTQYLVLLFMNADEAQSVLDYTQRISYAYAYGTPLLLGVNVFRLSIQGMGYSRLSLLSGVLEMVARIFISIGELPIEDETPEETEEEAEEMMEEAKILEKEEKKKI